MTKFRKIALAGAAAIALSAAPASAAELLYSFSSDSGTLDFSFTLDSNPTPDSFTGGLFFAFFDYPVSTPTGAETATIGFENSIIGGGVGISTPTFFFGLDPGSQLYSGPEASPTMLTGDFLFTGFVEKSASGPLSGTLSVTEVNAAVPEPGTWAMMLLGFGAMGWSFKRRRKLALA